MTAAGENGHSPERKPANPRTVPAPPRRGDAIGVPMFEVPESGLTNHQVWAAVVDELQRGGVLPRVDIEAWVRMSAIIDIEGDVLVVRVPNVLAERRAAGRYLTALEDAIHRVTGIRFGLRIALGDGRGDDDVRWGVGT